MKEIYDKEMLDRDVEEPGDALISYFGLWVLARCRLEIIQRLLVPAQTKTFAF